MRRLPTALGCLVAALVPHAVISARGRRISALEAEVAQLRNTARQAERDKDEFLATLSHELRTPLNATLGWIQLLRLHVNDPGQQRHALDVIERNAKRQARVVGDLLDMSRIVTGKLHLTRERVALDSVVRDAAATLNEAAAAKRIGITVDAPEEVTVAGDKARLRQIVSNLFSNALKFTPTGGQVTARVRADSGTATLEVSDTGIGIAPEVLPRLFESFHQAEPGLTRPYEGLGLGLTLVRTLVELHGGTVEAASKGLGQGATFTVRLPLARAGASFAA